MVDSAKRGGRGSTDGGVSANADDNGADASVAARLQELGSALGQAIAERDQARGQITELSAERDVLQEKVAMILGRMASVDIATPDDVGLMDHIGDTIARLGRDRITLRLALMEHGYIAAEEFSEGQQVDEVQRSLNVIAELAARIPELTAERDQAVADLAAATKAHDRTKGQLKVAKAAAAPKPAKPRAIGPLTAPQPAGEVLLKAIAAAETVELAFSDGARELVELPPQRITGDAWALAANGVRLRIASLPAHGLGHGEAAFQLAGFGLLLDGALVAYASRMDRLTVQPGTLHELKDDVIF